MRLQRPLEASDIEVISKIPALQMENQSQISFFRPLKYFVKDLGPSLLHLCKNTLHNIREEVLYKEFIEANKVLGGFMDDKYWNSENPVPKKNGKPLIELGIDLWVAVLGLTPFMRNLDDDKCGSGTVARNFVLDYFLKSKPKNQWFGEYIDIRDKADGLEIQIYDTDGDNHISMKTYFQLNNYDKGIKKYIKEQCHGEFFEIALMHINDKKSSGVFFVTESEYDGIQDYCNIFFEKDEKTGDFEKIRFVDDQEKLDGILALEFMPKKQIVVPDTLACENSFWSYNHSPESLARLYPKPITIENFMR